MAAVYVNNLVVNIGADFRQSFTLEDTGTNSTFDLTNYTVQSQMRKWSGSTSYTEFTTTVEYPSTMGKIFLVLTAQQTSALKPGRYIYDIVITDQVGVKTRVIEGMVLVTEGATR